MCAYVLFLQVKQSQKSVCNVYVLIYVCLHVCIIDICMCVCVFSQGIHKYTDILFLIGKCVYICVVCVHTRPCTCVYLYVCACECMYLYMLVCMYLL